jgi:CHRD domain-containing protein
MKSWIRTIVVAVASVGIVACGDDNGTEAPDDDIYVAQMTGAGEVPAVQTNASGTATFTRTGDTFVFTIQVQNMVGVTGAHIHMGAAGSNGGVVVPLFGNEVGIDIANGMLVSASFSAADLIASTGATMASLTSMMSAGGAYVNVHTLANPPGEIRGQLSEQ